ncbi:MAG: hypothetical protein ACD_5C00090G0003 [uncultured bacterium]|nr:MAG: hypothetical protein ACD_5C00090G0003 [uncultured bacterium]
MLSGFCVGPAPFLWKSLFLIVPIMTAISIALSLFILVGIYKNKNSKKKIWDNDIKKKFLYLTVLALSLLTYGLVGLSFEFYLLVFFFICIWILLGFFVGEYLKLMKIKCGTWFLVAAIAMIFALLFGICYLGGIKGRIETKKEVRASCHDSSVF